MCYYSMEGSTRQARQDEVLVVERLTHQRKGLVSPEDMHTGVCLTSGLRLELLYIPDRTRKRYNLGLEEFATFKMRHWLRRDVLLLDNGNVLPVQKLEIGQVVRVLQMSLKTKTVEAAPNSQLLEGSDVVPAARAE